MCSSDLPRLLEPIVAVDLGEGDDTERMFLVERMLVHRALELLSLGGVGEGNKHEALALSSLVRRHLNVGARDTQASFALSRLDDGLEEAVGAVGSDDGSAV